MLIFLIISLFISYSFVSHYCILKKSKYVSNLYNSNYNIFYSIVSKLNISQLESYLNSKEQKLLNSENPYGINITRYCLIKYVLSISMFIILFFNSKNILVSTFLFLIIYFLPDILIFIFEKNESIKLINEISNIVQNIILSLSANMSLYRSLYSAINVIKYDRFKREFSDFVNRYKMYNYSIVKAVNGFEKKFNTYEFNMFLSILVECEKEGNYIELLENFNTSLEMRYFKNLNLRYAKNLVITMIAIIIALTNSFLVIGYPIISEIISNVSEMFK